MDQYIGRLLDDRYEILEVIGTGGMAVVYKARCHRLNRLVAIKILKDEFSGDEEFRRRFHAEGEAVAMLSHPNIVQVYDVGYSEGANFIVMELIDGISLKQYMETKGVLNWKETLHFAMQIAQGLEHAHSRGIIHRDIKPHNVMVLKNGSVKVMDFGIARVMSKSNTLTKEALGSVHYISPEQAKGGYTDNRSDLYSLSVVMYEMMTGRPPYDGESPVAVAIQHINGGAPKPSSLNPNIPRGLEQIIMKGMALDVNDRYISATDMLHDMEEFRQNPDILFNYHSVLDDATQTIPVSGAIRPGGSAERPVQNRSRSDSRGRKRTEVSRNTESARRAQMRRKAEEERRAQEKSRIATVAIVVCSAVAVVALVVFLMALFNGALLNQEKDLVDVPFLVGQDYTDEVALEYPDFSIRLQPQEYDENNPRGRIIYQEPSGGSKVIRGTELWLTVSMGPRPEERLMDNLVDVDEAQAKAILGEDYKLIIRKEKSSLYEEGQVTRTDPAAGSPLTKGQTINIWISSGPPVETQTMPDVLGLTKEDALKVLTPLGFKNVRFEEVDSNKPEGEIVRQSIPKNEKNVDVTTEIVLELSKGPEETEPPTEAVRKNYVPDLMLVNIEVGRQELARAGFTENITIIEVASDREEGRILMQRPQANTLLAVNEPIVLQVSRGNRTSNRITFPLPLRNESYLMTFKLDDKQIGDPVMVETDEREYTVEVTGEGVQTLEIYIEGELYKTLEVVFGP